jgi:hypothetical protein
MKIWETSNGRFWWKATIVSYELSSSDDGAVENGKALSSFEFGDFILFNVGSEYGIKSQFPYRIVKKETVLVLLE